MVYGQDNAETPIVVRLSPEARTSAAAIRDLPVGLLNGQSVPLSAVAGVGVADGPAQIEHDKLQGRRDVDINVSGRDVQSFVAGAQRAVGQKVHLPTGNTLEWSGTFKICKVRRRAWRSWCRPCWSYCS